MNKLPSINVCPALLTQGFHTYSPEALQRLFAQAKVSHLLPFALQTSQERFWESHVPLWLSRQVFPCLGGKSAKPKPSRQERGLYPKAYLPHA